MTDVCWARTYVSLGLKVQAFRRHVRALTGHNEPVKVRHVSASTGLNRLNISLHYQYHILFLMLSASLLILFLARRKISSFFNEEQVIHGYPIDGAIVQGGPKSHGLIVYITTLLLQEASWLFGCIEGIMNFSRAYIMLVLLELHSLTIKQIPFWPINHSRIPSSALRPAGQRCVWSLIAFERQTCKNKILIVKRFCQIILMRIWAIISSNDLH